MTTNKPTTTQQATQQQQAERAFLLILALILIFVGFSLDGITDYGHHACFIVAGGCIGFFLGKLNK